MTTLPTKTSKPRVLIVEDEPLSQNMLKSALKKEGYEFAVAQNGQEAIDLYSQEFYSIIITDWVMPGMDGLELCRLIRSMRIDRYIYIIILSGQNTKAHLVEGLEAGADEYIFKPIHHSELRVRLEGACRILELESSLKQSMTEIRELSVRDRLTGCYNRVYMDHQLTQEIMRASRYHRPLSILMCDLDHFKSVNDTYGHLAGDEVLKSFVTIITSSFRNGVDWMARYGGEEFVIILPETDLAGAQLVAERMRERIAAATIMFSGDKIAVTASFGTVTLIPTYKENTLVMEQVLNVADTCLYQAKNAGRNQVISAEM